VDHEKLLTLVAQRVADGRVLRLIKGMLKQEATVEGRLFSHRARHSARGVITPLHKGNLGRMSGLGVGNRLAVDPSGLECLANGDGVVSYQELFTTSRYDALAFRDTQRISSAVEPLRTR